MAESSGDEPKKRKAGGRPFKKGQSGNPGGKPKALREVIALARSHTVLSINTLAEIAAKGDSEQARLGAANALLDRAWGKPKDTVALEGEGGGPLQIVIRRESDGA